MLPMITRNKCQFPKVERNYGIDLYNGQLSSTI